MNDAKYIGLDVHQATISAAVLDSTGKLVMESVVETKVAGWRQTGRLERAGFRALYAILIDQLLYLSLGPGFLGHSFQDGGHKRE
jgi:hypothetical protein